MRSKFSGIAAQEPVLIVSEAPSGLKGKEMFQR